MKWLRLYDDVLDDPKVQQLPPASFKHWINLLCLASKTEPRGTLPEFRAVAFRLRLPEPKAAALLKDFTDIGLLDRDEHGTFRPHNWEGRQRQSDNVAERVRKHRETVSSNDSVTLQKRTVDTDTDTDTDTEQGTPSSEGSAPASEPLKAAKSKAERKAKLPDDWTPSERQCDALGEQGFSRFEIDAELLKFQNYHRHKGDAGLDWGSAFANWMVRSRELSPARRSVASNGSRAPAWSPESIAAYALDLERQGR